MSMIDIPGGGRRSLLSSMYKHRHPDRRRAWFMFTNWAQHPFAGGGGSTEVNFDGAGLMKSALDVQKHGAPHLLRLPVSKGRERPDQLRDGKLLSSRTGDVPEQTSSAPTPITYRRLRQTLSLAALPRRVSSWRRDWAAVFPLVPIKVARSTSPSRSSVRAGRSGRSTGRRRRGLRQSWGHVPAGREWDGRA
jgi:hypothetical protein